MKPKKIKHIRPEKKMDIEILAEAEKRIRDQALHREDRVRIERKLDVALKSMRSAIDDLDPLKVGFYVLPMSALITLRRGLALIDEENKR